MKKPDYHYAALYTFSYMALGALLPLIGQYLHFIGFSGAQIGTITAAGTLVAIFAATVWGKAYHYSHNRHLLIMALCITAAGIGTVLMRVNGYWFFLCLFGCMYFFQAPIMALSDAVTLEDGRPFNRIRKWGSIGFALGAFLAGELAGRIGLPLIFPMYAGSFLIAAAMLFAIFSAGKKDRGQEREVPREKPKGRYSDLLQNKKLIRLILCTFFVGGTNVANNTYFSFLYIDGGGTIAGVGVVMLLMVGSEAVFMQWSAGLAKRFTLEKTILAAIGISVIRFGIYGLNPAYPVLIALFFLQGAVNGIILVEFVRYVSKLAPKGKEGMAIAAYYALGSNLSTIVCQLAGGELLDAFGSGGVYLFFSIFNGIGFLFYVKFKLYKA